MTTKPTIRVFVSSPGDVAEERVIAQRVLQRLADRFAAAAHVEAIFWEHEPLLATDNFQAQIPPPSAAEIFICILWSRLGTRLPGSVRRPNGAPYQSGTEFEFEDAIASFRRRGMPDLIVYRKTAEPVISLRDRGAVREALRQGELLDAFIRQWFHGTDGTLRAAFHPFKDSSEFEEHLELHALKLIGRRVKQATGERPAPAADARVTWTAGSPYRGLEAFDFEHEPIYFGRTGATSAAIRALREQAAAGRPFLLILGASGSGKSSLARAGVLPMLTRAGVVPGVAGWRRAAFRPGDARGNVWVALASALLRPEAVPELEAAAGGKPVAVPVAAPAGAPPEWVVVGTAGGKPVAVLASAVRAAPPAAGGSVARLADRLRREPAAVMAALANVLRGTDGRPGGQRLVLLVDQLEELFTLDQATDADRRAFLRLIEGMVTGGVWVVATLRSDFYHVCGAVPELARLKAGGGQYDVPPPSPTEIAAIIRQPAIATGLRFEHDKQRDERLHDLLADDAARCPESLPLLSFTLDELYKQRSRQNALSLSVYHRLGRLEGALAHRAGTVFADLPRGVQRALPRVFRQLVTLGGDDQAKAARKPAPTAAFARDAAAARFVSAFVEARLFTTKQADDGSPVVEITHEALLTRWKPVQKWLAADREHLLVLARVKAAAQVWEESGRSSDRLLARGQPLDEAKHLLHAGFALSASERALIRASRNRAWRNRQMKRLGVAVLAVLTVVSGVGFVLAERNRRQSEEHFTEARKTVDEFVTEISREELSVVPGLQDVRQKFAQRAVDRYEQFAAHRPNDPEVRAGLAQAKISLGQVVGGIGSLDRAVGEMKQAIELLETNVARDPSATNRLRLDKARNDLANLYWANDQKPEAMPLLDLSIADLEAIVRQDAGQAEARYQLGVAYNARGNCRRETGKKDGAQEDYEHSRDACLAAIDSYPKKADSYSVLGAATHNLSLVYKSRKDYKKSLELLDESAKYDALVLELEPASPGAVSNKGIGLTNRGLLLAAMGKRDEAGKAHAAAVAAGRRVVADNPKVTRYQWLLADALKHQARHLSAVEKFGESERVYQESCQILEGLVTRADDRPQYAVALIDNRLSLAEYHRGSKAGQKDEAACRKCLQQAIDAGGRLAAKFPRAAEFNYQYARAYFQLGVLEQEGDRHEAAAEAFRRAIDIYQDSVARSGPGQDPENQSEFLGWIDAGRSSLEKLGRNDEILVWIAAGEKLGADCPTRAGKQSLAGLLNTRGSIHEKAGRNREAIAAYRAGLAVARPAWEEARWHWYLHQAVAGAYYHLSALYQKTGDRDEEVRARQEWLRIWGGPLQSYNTKGLIDPDPPPGGDVVRKLRAEMAVEKGMKRFTIPCDFNGVKYPFHVYIMDVRWPKDPLEDQARWLEEERGGKIPEEVRESFRKLHKIAHENNVSFQDLCVYALGDKDKPPPKPK
jgi:tetratricopeptide (TPR) repeat protein